MNGWMSRKSQVSKLTISRLTNLKKNTQPQSHLWPLNDDDPYAVRVDCLAVETKTLFQLQNVTS